MDVSWRRVKMEESFKEAYKEIWKEKWNEKKKGLNESFSSSKICIGGKIET